MSRGITVRHCSIYEVPRAGINIGDGCWGGDLVEFCDVFDTVLETGDHGSFNSWGRDRYWELGGVDVQRIALDPEKESAAVGLRRADRAPQQSLALRSWLGYRPRRRLVELSLAEQSMPQRRLENAEGFYRVCENNVTVNNSLHPHVWFRDSQDVVRHNIVFRHYNPIGMPTPWGQECDFNLLNRPGETKAMPATVLEKQSGRDEHSIEVDAEFIKPSVGDYRVQTESPRWRGWRIFRWTNSASNRRSCAALAKTPVLPAAPEARATAIPPARGR